MLVGTDPAHEIFTREFFGPILGVFVYEDSAWADTVDMASDIAAYALTGSVFARDPQVIADASERLRFSAGNFYVNDKPTGAVVVSSPSAVRGRAAPTTRRAPELNLQRWSSPRVIKETFVPPTDYRYPHQG